MEPARTGTSTHDWLTAYTAALDGKAAGTVDAYLRALRQFLAWLSQRPVHTNSFAPDQFTRTAVKSYLAHLDQQTHSRSHRVRDQPVLSSFAIWLIAHAVIDQNVVDISRFRH